VKDIAGEVLLGRDIPLHRHMVGHLLKEEQLNLLHQLAEDRGICLENSKDGAMAAVTQAQKKKADITYSRRH
jgi:hypothetical protein